MLDVPSGAVDSLVARVSGMVALYLFGSCARGDAGPDADIDLGLLARKNLSPIDLFGLQEDLAAHLRRDVDLLDLRTASTVMCAQVLRDAIVIRDVDPQARQWFEMNVLAAYARLNEERREILEDVACRGMIYG